MKAIGRLLALAMGLLASLSGIAPRSLADEPVEDLQIVTKVRLAADRIEYSGLVTTEANAGVFDLYRVTNVAEGGAEAAIELLTAVPGGARTPDVSPDGGTVVFVGYTTEGHDLFTMPLSDDLPAEAGSHAGE